MRVRMEYDGYACYASDFFWTRLTKQSILTWLLCRSKERWLVCQQLFSTNSGEISCFTPACLATTGNCLICRSNFNWKIKKQVASCKIADYLFGNGYVNEKNNRFHLESIKSMIQQFKRRLDYGNRQRNL